MVILFYTIWLICLINFTKSWIFMVFTLIGLLMLISDIKSLVHKISSNTMFSTIKKHLQTKLGTAGLIFILISYISAGVFVLREYSSITDIGEYNRIANKIMDTINSDGSTFKGNTYLCIVPNSALQSASLYCDIVNKGYEALEIIAEIDKEAGRVNLNIPTVEEEMPEAVKALHAEVDEITEECDKWIERLKVSTYFLYTCLISTAVGVFIIVANDLKNRKKLKESENAEVKEIEETTGQINN